MNVVLGVSGGIAAYKAPDVVRRLQDSGAAVRVILTANAARFVSPLALAAVSSFPVIADQWGDASKGGVDHIEIARWANLLLIAPASADVIAKLAVGIADDALTTYAIAHRGVTAVAPSMNSFMLRHPTVVQNLATLRARGVEVIDSDRGLLACGDEGEGRMPDPPLLARWATSLLDAAASGSSRDLDGVRILVTAGPTREPIDPVRYLTNRSSGRMGYAIATAAARRGAHVTLVSGPTAITPPAGVEFVPVTTASEMATAVLSLAAQQDVVIKAAAVADFTASEVATQKIKRGAAPELTIKLKPTTDIVASLATLERRPMIVAFAAETQNVDGNAQEKLARKGADLIVANDVSDSAIGFDSAENQVTIFDRSGRAYHFEKAPKNVIAERILDVVVEHRTAAPQNS